MLYKLVSTLFKWISLISIQYCYAVMLTVLNQILWFQWNVIALRLIVGLRVILLWFCYQLTNELKWYYLLYISYHTFVHNFYVFELFVKCNWLELFGALALFFHVSLIELGANLSLCVISLCRNVGCIEPYFNFNELFLHYL